jgi:hypothetical protein
MAKQELMLRLQEILIPLETENLVTYVHTLTFEKAMRNPWLIGFFLLVLFYAVVKRSRPMLLLLFSVVSLAGLLATSLPKPDEEMSAAALLPLASGLLCIGSVLIYFLFIRED